MGSREGGVGTARKFRGVSWIRAGQILERAADDFYEDAHGVIVSTGWSAT